MTGNRILVIAEFLIRYYGYELITPINKEIKEVYLFKPFSKLPIIRLTVYSYDVLKSNYNVYLTNFNILKNTAYFSDNKFINITVNDEEFVDGDIINIGYNYESFEKLKKYFKNIEEIFYNTKNDDQLIKDIEFNILKNNNNIIHLLKINRLPIITYSIMLICCFLYNLSTIANENSHFAALIYLGASYDTFILAFKEYYRFITSAFLHSNLLHLMLNIFSLFWAKEIEIRLGYLRYSILLLLSILLGSSLSFIFNKNVISVGFSSAIYGLFTLIIVKMFNEGVLLKNKNMMMLIAFNLVINLLSFINVYAHIGGFIAGVSLYYLYFYPNLKININELRKNIIKSILILLIGIGIKIYTIKVKEPLYIKLDKEVIDIIKNENKQKEMLSKLERYYQNFYE